MSLIKHERSIANRTVVKSNVPSDLVGDWKFGGLRHRFNYDGSYLQVNADSYSIVDVTLTFGGETFTRINGGPGLNGVWRLNSADQMYDLTLGPHGFYAFVWEDDTSGGGYYVADATTLALVEHRARFECSGATITFTQPDGSTEIDTFRIAADVLTLTTPNGTFDLTRIPF